MARYFSNMLLTLSNFLDFFFLSFKKSKGADVAQTFLDVVITSHVNEDTKTDLFFSTKKLLFIEILNRKKGGNSPGGKSPGSSH